VSCPGAPDLSPAELGPLLTTARLGRAFVLLPSCGSTNDEVAARAATSPEGFLLAADEQTGGRGRRGRGWHSPAGENLYASLLLRPTLPARDVAPLTLVAGVALARALVSLGFAPRLKWPNDVLLESAGGARKVAGLLAEMASDGERVRRVILGVGVNVNGTAFPGLLAATATSLRLAGKGPLARATVLAAFVNALEPLYDEWLVSGPAAALDEWRRQAVLGQRCWVDRGHERIEGVATGVDEAGALLVRTDAGEQAAVHAGEVNWLGTR